MATTRRSLLVAAATSVMGGILATSTVDSAETGSQTSQSPPSGNAPSQATNRAPVPGQPELVTLATALDSQFDSVNVNRMGKGTVSVALPVVSTTTTSEEIDCRGFNSILVHITVEGAGIWGISLQNAMESGGKFVDAYDGAAQMTTGKLTADRCVAFRGVADWVKVLAAKVQGGGTCTVVVQPINL